MKTYVRFLSIMLLSIFLTACSVDQEAARLYKQENPLEIDISVPHPVMPGQPQRFQAVLSQNGQVVDDAEEVYFTIWKKDRSGPKEAIAAAHAGSGVYTAETTLHEEGIYYVKVNASANGSRIMPTKRFVVGEVAEEMEPVIKQAPQQHHKHH